MSVLLVAALALQDPAEAQGKVTDLIGKLHRQMATARERLQAWGRTEYVERLDRAAARLEAPLLAAESEEVRRLVQRQSYSEAMAQAARIESVLQDVLAILEDARLADERERLRRYLLRARELLNDQLQLQADSHAEPARLADRQSALRDRATGLANDLEQDGLADPGRHARDAAREMNDAASRFRGADLPGAKPPIDKAVRNLQNLIDRLRDRRRDADREAWIHVAEALSRIRVRQIALRSSTAELEPSLLSLSRAQQIRCRALARDQAGLAESLREIRKTLDAELAEVFVFALDFVIEDMQTSVAALAAAEPGRAALSAQDEAIRRLGDLIDAFRIAAARSKREPPVIRCPGGDPGNPPPPRHVPDVVELQLVLKLQESILRRTQAAREGLRGEPDELERALLRRLAEEERRLAELVRGFLSR